MPSRTAPAEAALVVSAVAQLRAVVARGTEKTLERHLQALDAVETLERLLALGAAHSINLLAFAVYGATYSAERAHSIVCDLQWRGPVDPAYAALLDDWMRAARTALDAERARTPPSDVLYIDESCGISRYAVIVVPLIGDRDRAAIAARYAAPA